MFALRPLPICARCRITLSRGGLSLFHSSALLFRGVSKPSRNPQPVSSSRHIAPALHVLFKNLNPASTAYTDTATIRNLLIDCLDQWCSSDVVYRRLSLMGLSSFDIRTLLKEFRAFARSELRGHSGKPTAWEDIWDAYTLSRGMATDKHAALDKTLTRRFISWGAQTRHPATGSFSHILEGTDLRFPQERFCKTRRFQRKFVLHVGPTNSGKTYQALQRLASARSGIYAGPLRLLAHEIWERLNRGEIAPAGADPNVKYPRPCNLFTGEEVRIVDQEADFTSCTVEMLPVEQFFEVAVIDEIQVIADPDRGTAWTQGILGLRAQEIHLCGEETAVDLVQSIVTELGDDLVVNRYERLSPLVVASKSLGRNLKNIAPGDCVVTFSRNGIFAMKERIEEKTGLRCAVAYGKLPPEVRSEQAALFNDPKSGFDVLVASDAIGMGLNLKIKRIIFETMHKWDGKEEVELSLSQIKQIAGRAGRYGLHGASKTGGIVTTLLAPDLPLLKRAMATPLPKLTQAYLSPTADGFAALRYALPPSTSFADLHRCFYAISVTRPPFVLPDLEAKLFQAGMVDKCCGRDLISFADMVALSNSPVVWRDPVGCEIAEIFFKKFATTASVDFYESVQGFGLLETLDKVKRLRKSEDTATKAVLEKLSHQKYAFCSKALPLLESLHKTIILYLWLSMRFPISFLSSPELRAKKEEIEDAIVYCLDSVVEAEAMSEDVDGVAMADKLEQLRDARLRRESDMAFHWSHGKAIGGKNLSLYQSPKEEGTPLLPNPA